MDNYNKMDNEAPQTDAGKDANLCAFDGCEKEALHTCNWSGICSKGCQKQFCEDHVT